MRKYFFVWIWILIFYSCNSKLQNWEGKWYIFDYYSFAREGQLQYNKSKLKMIKNKLVYFNRSSIKMNEVKDDNIVFSLNLDSCYNLETKVTTFQVKEGDFADVNLKKKYITKYFANILKYSESKIQVAIFDCNDTEFSNHPYCLFIIDKNTMVLYQGFEFIYLKKNLNR